MANKYQGTINKVYGKDGRYSLAMDDENWYGLGYNQPFRQDGTPAEDGDIAMFMWEQAGKYKNVVEGKLKIKKGDGPPKRKNTGSGGGRAKSNYATEKVAREKYWADKEARDIVKDRQISYHGALNTAQAIIFGAVNSEVVKVGGKAADKLDTIMGMVNELAENIFRDVQTLNDRYDTLLAPEKKSPAAPVDELEAPDEDFDEAGSGDDWGEEAF